MKAEGTCDLSAPITLPLVGLLRMSRNCRWIAYPKCDAEHSERLLQHD
jgi:hypothetical protein